MSQQMKRALGAARAKIAGLEDLICDLDLMLDVVGALANDQLTRAAGANFSAEETERIYFTFSLACRYSKKLKEFYYQDCAENMA